jgi:hypothetical protein
MKISVLLKIPVSSSYSFKQITNLFLRINLTHLVALWSASSHVKFYLKTTGTEIINPGRSITVGDIIDPSVGPVRDGCKTEF